MTKVSSIAIELKPSRGTFSSIAIGLKIDRQRNLIYNFVHLADSLAYQVPIAYTDVYKGRVTYY